MLSRPSREIEASGQPVQDGAQTQTLEIAQYPERSDTNSMRYSNVERNKGQTVSDQT